VSKNLVLDGRIPNRDLDGRAQGRKTGEELLNFLGGHRALCVAVRGHYEQGFAEGVAGTFQSGLGSRSEKLAVATGKTSGPKNWATMLRDRIRCCCTGEVG